MRLICPNCDAQYEVDASMLPPQGRDVQCSACGKVWFFTPPEAQSAPVEAPSLRTRGEWAAAPAAPDIGTQPPVPEARFLSDEDLDDDDPDSGLTPESPLEWQKAWDQALGKTVPHPDVTQIHAAEPARDVETDFTDELNDLSARTVVPVRPSRTEIAARRALAVLAQKDPLSPDTAAPENANPAPSGPNSMRSEPAQDIPAPALPPQEEVAEPHLSALSSDESPLPPAQDPHYGDGTAIGDASSPQEAHFSFPPAAEGLDEPHFDDSLDDPSAGVPVPTTARLDPLQDAEGQPSQQGHAPDIFAPEGFPTEALLRRLRRSRPELPPEGPEEEIEPLLDEEEILEPLPRRPKLDEEKLALLREEVELETRARAAEAARAAGRGLEMQPDLGLLEAEPPARLHIGPRSAPSEPELAAALPESAAAQSRGPRRELLPDIERINQTLSASGTTRGKLPLPPLEAAEAQRKGFRRGFVVALLIAVLLALVYQNAAILSAKLPALRPLLDGYVALIDSARLGIDQLLRRLLDSQTL